MRTREHVKGIERDFRYSICALPLVKSIFICVRLRRWRLVVFAESAFCLVTVTKGENVVFFYSQDTFFLFLDIIHHNLDNEACSRVRKPFGGLIL